MFDKFKSMIKPTTNERPSGVIEYIIVGLGNPGREYENTRHNAGFLAIEYIAKECGANINKIKFKSLYADTMLNEKRVLLLKPQTFMNSSGEAVRDAAAFYKVPLDKVIVIYDDVSLAVGKMRIRSKGTDGGHNGIKSIIYLTGADAFPRIKIGVGQKPSPEYDLAAWVLSRFIKPDLDLIEKVIIKASEAVQFMVVGNVEEAMNKYNS
jgi:PTH1 family peptidyl-tRNA hydrolase